MWPQTAQQLIELSGFGSRSGQMIPYSRHEHQTGPRTDRSQRRSGPIVARWVLMLARTGKQRKVVTPRGFEPLSPG